MRKLTREEIVTRTGKAVEEAKKIIDNPLKDNEFLSIDEVKKIYGSKGGLRLTYNLDDKKMIVSRLTSKYRKLCDQIKTKYQAFKIESKVEYLQTCNASLTEKSQQLSGDFAELSKEIGRLCYCFGENVDKSFKVFSELKIKVNRLKQLQKDLNSAADNVFIPACLVISVATIGSPTALVSAPLLAVGSLALDVAAISNFIRLNSKKKEMKKFLESENGKEFRKNLDNLLKHANSVYKDSNEQSDNINIFSKTVKIYNDFVNSCGDLAYKYLRAESNSKLKHAKKINDSKSCSPSDIVEAEVGLCKIMFAALICSCSRNPSHIEYGRSNYYNAHNYYGLLKAK